MINKTEIRVRYQETDQMGVVYNANYYVWFEIGRTEFFREMGLEYKTMEQEGILVPLVESRCFYKIPAKYDDEIIIKTKLTELKEVKARFEYEIIRKIDEKLLATGSTVHAFVSKDLKIINLKKKHSDIFDRVYKTLE